MADGVSTEVKSVDRSVPNFRMSSTYLLQKLPEIVGASSDIFRFSITDLFLPNLSPVLSLEKRSLVSLHVSAFFAFAVYIESHLLCRFYHNTIG